MQRFPGRFALKYGWMVGQFSPNRIFKRRVRWDSWPFGFAKCTFVTKQVSTFCMVLLSLPLRGAWIEISGCSAQRHTHGRRSPYGERGLKSLLSCSNAPWPESLPLRGAWIEIPNAPSLGNKTATSLPLRGAWIEITRPCRRTRRRPSLPFRGAWIEISWWSFGAAWASSLPLRGAWIEITAAGRSLQCRQVAPLTGSVD